ncbi:MAG: hypothetical protein AB7H97_12005 [Pseudobdellovibrionaceae bacterium]
MSHRANKDEPTEGYEVYAGFVSYKFYTTAELAAISGQKVPFWEARRAKELAPAIHKFGRSVKYLGKDIIAYLKSERRGGDHE